MPRIPTDDLKRYYTIGEVASMFDISKSLIRFWETEFDLLKPHKNSKGDRRFTPQNLEQLETIYHLVKERGFTISGAKEEIHRQKEVQREKDTQIQALKSARDCLDRIREDL
jgi:DNA-binding transcriptional MerR regulator